MTKNSAPHNKLRAIILCTSGHLGSGTILHHLLRLEELETVGIIIVSPLPISLRQTDKLYFHLKKVGLRFASTLVYQYAVQKCIFFIIGVLDRKKQRIGSVWQMARTMKIPTRYTDDINSEESRKFISSLAPDIMVSAYFNQILSRNTIGLAKQEVLNVHPSLLPSYRGAMSYFWVVKNGEEKSGVTVHSMTEKVDSGPILHQKSFEIDSSWTQLEVLFKTATLGAELLRMIIQNYNQDGCFNIIEPNQYKASYFSMPSGQDFKEYLNRNRFISIRSIFRFLWNHAHAISQ